MVVNKVLSDNLVSMVLIGLQCKSVLWVMMGQHDNVCSCRLRKHNAWLPPSSTGHVEYVSRYSACHHYSFISYNGSPWRGV